MKGKRHSILSVLLVLAVVASLALVTVVPAGATAGVTATPTPNTASTGAKYDITFTTDALTTYTAGFSTFTVTFPTGTTVPSSIAKGNITVADTTVIPAVAGAPPEDPTISGRAVTIKVPGTNFGGLPFGNIAAGDSVQITFAVAAGIVNPKTPGAAYTLTVGGSPAVGVETTGTSAVYTIATKTTISPTHTGRGGTVNVTAWGLAPNTTGTIQLAGVAISGATALIGSDGIFNGSFTASAATAAGGAVTVVDGNGLASAGTAYTQDASATPRVTSAVPGQVVSVDLVDFTPVVPPVTNTIVDGSTMVAGAAAANSPAGAFTIPATGSTTSLAPYKFIVPIGTTDGVKNVVITESNAAAKSATFMLTIGQRVLSVTPNSAAPGSAISISGAGFTANGTIPIGGITMTATAPAPPTPVNGALINIASDGSFLWTGIVPTVEASILTTGSKTFTATDAAGLVGTSSGFTLPTRTLILNPATGVPGTTIAASGAGMTVGSVGGVATTVTITNTFNAATWTFPINADGTWSGTVSVPTGAGPGTITYTATDNSGPVLVVGGIGVPGVGTNKSVPAALTVPAGTISVSPVSGPTGAPVTITGSNFPANQSVTTLTIGGGSALPLPVPTTSSTGSFTVNTNVPAAAAGGSLPPGAVVVSATVGVVTGSTAFTIPTPSITLSATSVASGGSLTISGSNFSALAPITVMNIGGAPALPSPAPLPDSMGSFTANVTVPPFNPGTYTVTVTNGGGVFTATATLTITTAPPAPVLPGTVLAPLVTAGALNSAFSPNTASPGTFLSYIPGVPGNTLATVAAYQTVIVNVTLAGQSIPAGFRGQPGQTTLSVGVNFLTYAP